MPETLRLSVRALVEFTHHGEDISPAPSLRDMTEGMLGHKARQAALGGEGWRSEVPLQLRLPIAEDAELLLSGRMDAFLDGDVPVVEEIKLWQSREAPGCALTAHRLQAVCYGHMLCAERGLPEVRIRVCYVTRGGRLRAAFPETLTAGACAEAFDTLLQAWLRRWQLVREHRRLRDGRLAALRFPFDAWRPGQREMAAQVYTAVQLQRRLFACMPTGTGKSAAALFPALKALGAGLTRQVYYLTARGTQRQGALDALELMRRQPLTLWTLTLDAKEKQCPHWTVCDAEHCPRAKGHFLRDAAAVEEMLRTAEDFSPAAIAEMAEKHCLCPFEFSLALAENADLVICDYNYALDPAVHIQRVFDQNRDVTLLIDEAHNLPGRLRDMLSAELDGSLARELRTAAGKKSGRRTPAYRALTGLLHALEDVPAEGEREGRLPDVPQRLADAAQELLDVFLDRDGDGVDWGEAAEDRTKLLRQLLAFNRCRQTEGERAVLWQGSRHPTVHLFALDVGTYFAEATEGLRGVICFSATLHPLGEMRRLLGCAGEEDASFSMPSPFPPENLLLLRQDIDTRYRSRAESVDAVCAAIRAMTEAHAGHYIAFFPSFAYLRQCAEHLELPCLLQRPGMSDADRRELLGAFRPGEPPVLALCVMGGLFSEGIDLPGEALDGVAVVGVGLPQVNLFQETLRSWYEQTAGEGFLYAYQLPGMQKVAQAVGRVIRTEHDRGVALLLDTRFGQGAYRRLCPPHWEISRGPLEELLQGFWAGDAGEKRSSNPDGDVL